LGLLLVLFLLMTATSAIAQDSQPGDGDEGSEPPRGVHRAAPARDPLILEQETLATGAIRTVVALPAVADVYVASGRPDQNFGADALFLGYNQIGDAFGAERIFLRFDVPSSIPDGALINEAILQLRLSFSSPASDVPMGTVLRRLTTPWNEFAVTWSNQPTWAENRASNEVGSALTWYYWDVTTLVADWSNGTYVDNGMAIIGDEQVQQRERAFYSRETISSYFPQLIIDYTNLGDTLPPIITVNSLPGYSPLTFTVAWSGSDQGPAGIAYYDGQYRVDGGAWVDWLVHTTATSAQFTGENGRLYEFRARGVDNVGNIEPYGAAEASTTIDNAPPTTQVNALPVVINTNNVTVSWTGNDQGGSGIQYYDVHYRFNGGPWIPWQQQTLATSALFTAMNDGFYEFEARAVDQLGHAEPFLDQPEADVAIDAQAPFIVLRSRLPFIAR
jgi:hypothetical protein